MSIFKEELKMKDIIKKILSTIIDCIVPTIPVMIGAGMMKVLLIVLGPSVLNILSETNPTYLVLSFVADAGYYFMPVYIAIGAAEVFKVDKYLAAMIGAMLLSPAYIEHVNMGTTLNIFGLPISLTNYSNQVISSIIIIWIMSYIYHFLDKHLGKNAKPILLPLLTILIMIPIAFSVVGPLGVWMGEKLVELIIYLQSLGPIGNAIMCALLPFVAILGLGGANVAAMILLASRGMDPILFFANVLYNNILGFVTLALYLRKKNPQTLAAAITASVGGVSEPALFGIVMKDFKALMALVVGCFFGGLYAGISGVKTYAIASFGAFGLVTTIGPDSSIIQAIIALIISCVIGFIISYLTHKQND